jgi:hypothetical protein
VGKVAIMFLMFYLFVIYFLLLIEGPAEDTEHFFQIKHGQKSKFKIQSIEECKKSQEVEIPRHCLLTPLELKPKYWQ